MSDSIIEKLSPGDMRTTGRSDEVVQDVLADPRLISSVIDALQHANAAVWMRAADALEKISKQNHSLLEPYQGKLVSILEVSDLQEVQWHLAQILPRLCLSEDQLALSYALISWNFLNSHSSIVRTWSLQAMAELSAKLPEKRAEVRKLVEDTLNTGTPAMKSRARKIIKQLKGSIDE